MFNKVSIVAVLLLALIAVGLIPFLASAITGSIAIGVMILVVLTGGVGYWLSATIQKPIQKLTQMAQVIATSVKHDMSFPDLSNLNTGIGHEMSMLAEGLRETANAFQKRLTELNSIHAISQTITSSTLDYEKTVKSVLAAVQKVVDYDAAEVAVLRGTNLMVEAWWGKDGFKDTTGRKYRLGKGPTGTIADTKKPLFMPTVQTTEDLQRTIGYSLVENEFIAKTTKLIINSFLGIPLLLGDRLIGTLTLVHHQEGFFTEDDMRQLNKLADHASIAIDNALQVREREETLRKQIQELRIEIDQAKLSTQVQEVVDTDYFRNLQASAARMRERYGRRDKDSVQGAESEDDTIESLSHQTTEILPGDVSKPETGQSETSESDKI
jgi:hypothetical protein